MNRVKLTLFYTNIRYKILIKTKNMKYIIFFILIGIFNPLYANSNINYDYNWTHDHPILIDYVKKNKKSIIDWTPMKIDNSKKYINYIYDILKKEGVPKEILILAAIESGFRTNVVSKSQAVGMWQFVEDTAKDWGLKVNANIDERNDWKKSTIAAARYIKWMAEKNFDGNYELAILAYNAGIGKVNRLIEKYGTNDPWTLIGTGELETESNEFLPKFLSYLHYYYYIEELNQQKGKVLNEQQQS